MQDQKPIGKWISILGRYHQLQMGRLLEPLGIGLGQYPLLLDICHHPGRRQDYLTGRLFLNKSSVARAVAQLEQNGYLERRVDPQDKRANLLYPTPKAFGAREQIIGHSAALSDEMTAGFTDGEKEELRVLLKRVVDNLSSGPSKACADFPPLFSQNTPNESEDERI